MTAGFGSENLFLFREGSRSLTVLDVGAWRAFELDFAGLGVGISTRCLDDLTQAIREGSKRVLGSARGPEEEKIAKERIARSAGTLARLIPLRAILDSEELALAPAPLGLLRPVRASLWLASADGPAETFHQEDYEAGRPLPLDPHRYDRAHRLQRPLRRDGRGAASLSGRARRKPRRVESSPRLGPRVPARSPGGAAHPQRLRRPRRRRNRGHRLQHRRRGALSSECWAAMPWVRDGVAFHTLYAHLDFGDAPAGVLKTLSIGRGRVESVRVGLASAGFELRAAFEASGPIGQRWGARCEVWTRGGDGESDALHLCESAPGREASGRPTLPPFLLAARARGSFRPEIRAQLLASIPTLRRKA
jgi:hypothetical protein